MDPTVVSTTPRGIVKADFFALPFRDLLFGLEKSLVRGARSLVLVMVGAGVGWWVYVPLHELLHALGCLLGGGTVSILEVSRLYGGHVLAAVFPFVEAGGRYAGRLSGFDTHGSDATYLLTVLLPFVLTLWPGVWLLRRAARSGHVFLYGFSLSLALAPLLSLTGDAYEIGSILTVQVHPWSGAGLRAAVVGDDVFVVASGMRAAGAGPGAWSGLVISQGLGALWAFATYAAAARVSDSLGEPAVRPVTRPDRG